MIRQSIFFLLVSALSVLLPGPASAQNEIETIFAPPRVGESGIAFLGITLTELQLVNDRAGQEVFPVGGHWGGSNWLNRAVNDYGSIEIMMGQRFTSDYARIYLEYRQYYESHRTAPVAFNRLGETLPRLAIHSMPADLNLAMRAAVFNEVACQRNCGHRYYGLPRHGDRTFGLTSINFQFIANKIVSIEARIFDSDINFDHLASHLRRLYPSATVNQTVDASGYSSSPRLVDVVEIETASQRMFVQRTRHTPTMIVVVQLKPSAIQALAEAQAIALLSQIEITLERRREEYLLAQEIIQSRN